jgi:hypothetical protein
MVALFSVVKKALSYPSNICRTVFQILKTLFGILTAEREKAGHSIFYEVVGSEGVITLKEMSPS